MYGNPSKAFARSKIGMATANLDSSRTSTSTGLRVKQEFCPAGVLDPFTTAEWETRSAAIKDESGGILFEQDNCEIPTTWSQLATNVIVSKYFYGEVGTPEREYSVRQLVHRVTRTITDWGMEDGYFASADDADNFYRDLSWLCLHQHGA
ncbi:vitamin B12-dependent ribonucleotide reductase, partial [Planctomycetota bacterium]